MKVSRVVFFFMIAALATWETSAYASTINFAPTDQTTYCTDAGGCSTWPEQLFFAKGRSGAVNTFEYALGQNTNASQATGQYTYTSGVAVPFEIVFTPTAISMTYGNTGPITWNFSPPPGFGIEDLYMRIAASQSGWSMALDNVVLNGSDVTWNSAASVTSPSPTGSQYYHASLGGPLYNFTLTGDAILTYSGPFSSGGEQASFAFYGLNSVPTPEPVSCLLTGTGLLGLGYLLRKRH